MRNEANFRPGEDGSRFLRTHFPSAALKARFHARLCARFEARPVFVGLPLPRSFLTLTGPAGHTLPAGGRVFALPVGGGWCRSRDV